MVRLRAPSDRICERCGRREHWSEGGWSVVVEDGDPLAGDVFCLHEWDINGTFSPIVECDG
ncbi:MAG: HEWD family protein [Haloferacaceae archaeon]